MGPREKCESPLKNIYIILLYPRQGVYSFRLSVRSYFHYGKVLVKVSLVMYISVTTDQKAFIFGP